ncbi:plasmid pRiA4b ORF-3 family protein [Modestobacter marinus]|uniref:plasmid pRiA4b ORF-3 family protein n=1 Tax=Modestobacter marinus TaxID=477641 RepID=UPI001C96A7D8|nr:plasmid pRiA4b ORF-3 family protein [Modestobacter marinus]
MRADVAEMVERLRAARVPELLRLVDEALPDGVEPLPDPDVVEPYRWLVARVGDGVKLTAAGYLPPALVRDTMQRFGWDADRIGAGNREDLTGPVRDLRDTARQLGLVRVYRGRLLPTSAGRRYAEDPTALWAHIARRLPLGSSDAERQAGLLWLLAVAAGRSELVQPVVRGLAALGWVDRASRRPVHSADVHALVRPTRMVFERLGLITSRARRRAHPNAPALSRAVLIGDEPLDLPKSDGVVEASARELTVTLLDVQPPVWRRLVVPESMSLRELHAVLQTVMGWQDAHLHLFRVQGVQYGDAEDFPGQLGDEEATTVGDVANRSVEFSYDYDFGDGWEHRLRVGERTSAPDTPHCLDGAGACPPEDCGGAPGYQRLLQALADPGDPEHAELTEWISGPFDPEAFDVSATNDLLELYDRHTRQRRRR